MEDAGVQLFWLTFPRTWTLDGLGCYWLLFTVEMQAFNEAVYQFGYTLSCALLLLSAMFSSYVAMTAGS